MTKICKRLVLAIMLLCLNVGMFTMVADAASKLKTPEITLSNVASTGKIKISWGAVKNAVSYKVYRSTDGKSWTCIVTTKNKSVTNTSTTAGKTYYYKVKAIASKSSNNSNYSEVKKRTCDLKRPTITLSTETASGKTKVSWEKISSAVEYKVYRSVDKEDWNLLGTTESLSYTAKSGVAGKKYYYRVKAIAKIEAADSAASSYKYRTWDLAKPVISLSDDAETGKIKISWGKIDGAKEYQVYRGSTSSSFSKIKTTSGTSYVDKDAATGKKYYYKVKAISTNSAANSAFSSYKYRTCKGKGTTSDTSGENVYQKEVVALAVDIAENWNTVYAHGQSKGEKNPDGTYGFDCSGFASYVLNTVMKRDDRVPSYRMTSTVGTLATMSYAYNAGVANEFKIKNVAQKDMQPGDIIFFSQKSKNDHCGIYIGDGKFAHSSSSKNGVCIATFSTWYKDRVSVIRRFIPEEIKKANTEMKIDAYSSTSSGCYLYKKFGSDSSSNRVKWLKNGAKVTVIYGGFVKPGDYSKTGVDYYKGNTSASQAYVKTSDGKYGFVYTKNLKK